MIRRKRKRKKGRKKEEEIKMGRRGEDIKKRKSMIKMRREGDEKRRGENDKEKGKCTYISEYGLEESKKILHQITNEAISMLDEFGKKAEFLKELARYIETRNK